jgi:hypothetical protein
MIHRGWKGFVFYLDSINNRYELCNKAETS